MKTVKRSDAIMAIVAAAAATYVFHGEIQSFLGWGNNIIKPYAHLIEPIMLFIFFSCVAIFGGYTIWLFYEEWLRKNAHELSNWIILWSVLIIGCNFVVVGLWVLGILYWLMAFGLFLVMSDTKRREEIIKQEKLERQMAEELAKNNME